MGAVAPILSVVGTVAGIVQGQKAAKSQKRAAQQQQKAQKVNQRISDVRAARERRQQMAQARVLQAQQQAAGFSSGAGMGSSAVQGAVGGLQSQLAGQMAFSNQVQGLSGEASQYNIAASGFQSQAASQQALGNLFQQGASIFSGPTFK